MRIVQCFVVIAVAVASASVDAQPCKVVVLDFDGPTFLAAAGRSKVMALLGDTFGIVSQRTWLVASAGATRHGPQRWKQAAARSGVDAVIEGWVQDEGRSHVLTISVREAVSGQEIDTTSVKLSSAGAIADPEREAQFAQDLEDILGWVECTKLSTWGTAGTFLM